MNHTQFLCYGLLKIFLKEAIDINPDVKGLICSYFLKTAIFWEITVSPNQWNPSSLLSCFWNCFRRLLQWVSCSYCPNFFVPQNNMFGGKLEGRNRDKLLQHLKILYYEGYRCLLRCQSLADTMTFAMHRNVEIVVRDIENIVIAEEIINECDLRLESVVFKHCTAHTGIKSVLMYKLTYENTNMHQRFLLKTCLHRFLKIYSLSSTNDSPADVNNRSRYSNVARRMNILGRCRTDSVAHILYQAMLCYNNGRYKKALRLVQKVKEKISAPFAIYWHNQTKKQYRDVGLDHLPIETVLRRHFLQLIEIDNDKCIPELHFERLIIGSHTKLAVLIPPLVCTFLLQYLCQRRLDHIREAEEALYELSLVVQHDYERHIGIDSWSTSWQILGICQQMSGDDRAACRSFMTAQQLLYNAWFKFATCVRLGIILVNYF